MICEPDSSDFSVLKPIMVHVTPQPLSRSQNQAELSTDCWADSRTRIGESEDRWRSTY